MTREEAKSCIGTIEMLQRLAYNIHGVMDVIDADNCKKIIKALEQEPCEDAISRKALIERINHAEENFKADHMESIGSDEGDPFVDGVLSGVFNVREMVMQAPSVTPQPKAGHWIEEFNDLEGEVRISEPQTSKKSTKKQIKALEEAVKAISSVDWQRVGEIIAEGTKEVLKECELYMKELAESEDE